MATTLGYVLEQWNYINMLIETELSSLVALQLAEQSPLPIRLKR